MPNAVVVGASSGIGRALARELADEGYDVGITARSVGKLESLAAELPTDAYPREMDVTRTAEARADLRDLVEEMGGLDLLVLSAAIGPENEALDWEAEADTIATNVEGFAALAVEGMHQFADSGGGHLVGISSLAMFLGIPTLPAYSASKAFVSNYTKGLRYWAARRDLDVTVTDVRPGYVDTKLAKGDRTFWVADPETAASQIARAIRRERKVVYVTRRWRFVGWLFRAMPDALLERMMT